MQIEKCEVKPKKYWIHLHKETGIYSHHATSLYSVAGINKKTRKRKSSTTLVPSSSLTGLACMTHPLSLCLEHWRPNLPRSLFFSICYIWTSITCCIRRSDTLVTSLSSLGTMKSARQRSCCPQHARGWAFGVCGPRKKCDGVLLPLQRTSNPSEGFNLLSDEVLDSSPQVVLMSCETTVSLIWMSSYTFGAWGQ